MLTKVKRLQAKIDKETQRKIVPQPATRRLIKPTLVSFMDIRSGLQGQERVGTATSTPARNCRKGQEACKESIFSPEHGEERVRPPMRGSLEHLLLQEAQVLTKGSNRSQSRKRPKGAESMELGEGLGKPGGRKGQGTLRGQEKRKVRP